MNTSLPLHAISFLRLGSNLELGQHYLQNVTSTSIHVQNTQYQN